jgi:hypothetical protein
MRLKIASEPGPMRLTIGNLLETFFDVDGEPLLDRLIGLCRVASSRNLPILFQ